MKINTDIIKIGLRMSMEKIEGFYLKTDKDFIESFEVDNKELTERVRPHFDKITEILLSYMEEK